MSKQTPEQLAIEQGIDKLRQAHQLIVEASALLGDEEIHHAIMGLEHMTARIAAKVVGEPSTCPVELSGPCMPRVSDGRCIWCERDLPARSAS